MSGAVAFDTLKFVERLEAGGFTHALGRGDRRGLRRTPQGEQRLATNADLRGEMAAVNASVKEIEARLEAKIETFAANLKVEILRSLVMTQIALAGFIFAAIKFVK